MAQCLVTGGAGFIGSHLVAALLTEGHRVSVLDDFSTGKHENLCEVEQRIKITRGSVTDPDTMTRATECVEIVFHLAALPSVQRSVEDPVRTHEVCATGTLQVLRAAQKNGVRRVIYAASSSAYGGTPGAVRTEDDPVAPLSPYAVAKLAGEHYCSSFTSVFNLETVRLRFFNIFGPRQDPSSPYSGVIALFAAAMAEGRAPQIHGDGLQSRDFTYVSNAVQALIKAATAPGVAGKVYNIGNGGNTRVIDLVKSLNQLLDTNIIAEFGPARPGDVRHSQANIERARADLGYQPQVTFLDGLRLTLESHRQASRSRKRSTPTPRAEQDQSPQLVSQSAE